MSDMWPVAFRILLRRTWWVVFPAFVLLVGRLSFERACADPYNLLAATMATPVMAWIVALLYVSAHVWLLAAYIHTAGAAENLWPPLDRIRVLWDRELLKIVLMAAVLAIEHSPVAFWRLLASAVPSVCGSR